MMEIEDVIATSYQVAMWMSLKQLNCQLSLLSAVLLHSVTFKLSTPEATVKLSI